MLKSWESLIPSTVVHSLLLKKLYLFGLPSSFRGPNNIIPKRFQEFYQAQKKVLSEVDRKYGKISRLWHAQQFETAIQRTFYKNSYLFQKVICNPSSNWSSICLELDFHILSKSTRIVIPDSLSISKSFEKCQHQLNLENYLLKGDWIPIIDLWCQQLLCCTLHS